MILYAHPFSSYSQKALVAFYEHDLPFTYRHLGPDDPSAGQELAALWPLGRFPVLVDQDRTFLEASIIVEHVDGHAANPHRLVPTEPAAALEVRMLDRVFDNYVMTPMQKIVFDHRRTAGDRDPCGVREAHQQLQTIYDWLNANMTERRWAAGEAFSLADCAAAPSLFYADWVHPIAEQFTSLRDYRRRLLGRLSFARAVEEARPYRSLFPPGAPDRD